MGADVTILAALLAGLVSFLSPCVLPLVPPYLVFLAGTSLERLAEAEPPPQVRRDTVIAAVLFVLGFSTVFVALGASASVVGALMRFYANELAVVAGIAIIIMGLHFLGVTPIALLYRQARRALGRLCDGACLRTRLDAVHRPHPRGHSRGGGDEGDGGQGGGPARRLFARARRAVHHRGAGGRAVCRVPDALSRPPRPCRAGDGRTARAHRDRLSRRRFHPAQQLVDRELPGAAEHRVTFWEQLRSRG